MHVKEQNFWYITALKENVYAMYINYYFQFQNNTDKFAISDKIYLNSDFTPSKKSRTILK